MTKTVVITGCSSGFGLASAVAFAERGDQVVATMRNLARRGALDDALAAAGAEAEVVAMDVDDDTSVRTVIEGVAERDGIDVLVNNAGIGGRAGPIEHLTDDDWLQVLGTNLLGTIRPTRAALPAMRAQGSGAIVNVSSVAGRLPGSAMTSAYSASKHAVCAFSDSVLAEVEDFGLTVHCIEPGFFATSIVDNADMGAWTGTAYEDHAAHSAASYRANMAAAPPPAAVVDAIVAAADGATGDSIHEVVGDMATLAVGAMADMTYVDFRAMMREMSGRD